MRRLALIAALFIATPAAAQGPLPTPARIFEEAIQTARAITDTELRDRAWRRIAEGRARAHDWPAARTALRSVRDTDARDDATALVALIAARADMFTEAQEITRAIDDAALRAQTLGRVAREMARAGQFPAALRAAGTLQVGDVRAMTFAFIAEIASRVNNADVTRGGWAEADQALARIGDRFLRDTNITIVAAARARAGDYAAALALARTIVDRETRLSAASELAATAIAARAWEAARAVAEYLAQEARAMPAAADQARVLAEAADIRLRAEDRAGALPLIDDARRIADGLPTDGERAYARSRVAREMILADRAAGLAYARQESAAIERAQVLVAAASALVVLGEPDEALALAQDIGDPDLANDARRSAIVAIAARDRVRALSLSTQLAPPQRNLLLAAIADARAETNDGPGAVVAAEAMTEVELRDAVLANAARALADRHHNAAGAREAAARIADRGVREDIMVDVVDEESRAGNHQAAYALARSLQIPAYRAGALALVAGRLARR